MNTLDYIAVNGPLSTTPADLKLMLDLLIGTKEPQRIGGFNPPPL